MSHSSPALKTSGIREVVVATQHRLRLRERAVRHHLDARDCGRTAVRPVFEEDVAPPVVTGEERVGVRATGRRAQHREAVHVAVDDVRRRPSPVRDHPLLVRHERPRPPAHRSSRDPRDDPRRGERAYAVSVISPGAITGWRSPRSKRRRHVSSSSAACQLALSRTRRSETGSAELTMRPSTRTSPGASARASTRVSVTELAPCQLAQERRLAAVVEPPQVGFRGAVQRGGRA